MTGCVRTIIFAPDDGKQPKTFGFNIRRLVTKSWSLAASREASRLPYILSFDVFFGFKLLFCVDVAAEIMNRQALGSMALIWHLLASHLKYSIKLLIGHFLLR